MSLLRTTFTTTMMMILRKTKRCPQFTLRKRVMKLMRVAMNRMSNGSKAKKKKKIRWKFVWKNANLLLIKFQLLTVR